MKTVYWIDDDPTYLLHVAQGVFPRLWDKDIVPIVFIMGDYFKEDQNQQDVQDADAHRIADSILGIFLDYCEEKDGWEPEGKTYQEKSELRPCKDHVRLISASDPKVSQLIKAWKDEKILAKWISGTPDELKVDWLVDSMQLNAGACVALDLALIFGDVDRLQPEEETLPIMSIEIYHALTDRGHPCFLFTQNTYKDAFTRHWGELSSKKYPNRISHIYSRNYLKEKYTHEYNNVVKALLDLIEQTNQ